MPKIILTDEDKETLEKVYQLCQWIFGHDENIRNSSQQVLFAIADIQKYYDTQEIE